MNAGNVALAAVQALRALRGRYAALYSLYSSEECRAWVAGAEVARVVDAGDGGEFFRGLGAVRQGLFLLSPNLQAASSQWPAGVLLEPRVELEIGPQGVRTSAGEPEEALIATVTAALAAPVPEPALRGSGVRERWSGESDADYCARLERAIELVDRKSTRLNSSH